ncbi:MAG: hypothetical protein ACRD3O_00010 [Terriglobia bacterium]
MQPTPYIDEQTGERLYNPLQAARLIEAVTQMTVRNWAKKGVTSFGLELHVRREPMTHHRRSTQTPRSFRQTRLLLPEPEVLEIREHLQAVGRKKPEPGPFTAVERDALEGAVIRRRLPLAALSH